MVAAMKGVCLMLSVYPACFFKEGSGFAVVFPDLNWLATDGKSEADAMNMAVDCLAGYLYTIAREGEKAPVASKMCDVSLDAIAKELDADTKGSFVSLVSVDVEKYAKENFERAVRKTLRPVQKTAGRRMAKRGRQEYAQASR